MFFIVAKGGSLTFTFNFSSVAFASDAALSATALLVIVSVIVYEVDAPLGSVSVIVNASTYEPEEVSRELVSCEGTVIY
jgi:hypothetical protein